MSNRADRDLLGDILEALRRAEAYSAGQSYEQFLVDTKTQDAVIRTLEIIGEATKGLSPSLRERYSGIPWKNMAGLRDKLIHDYFGVATWMRRARAEGGEEEVNGENERALKALGYAN